MIAKYLLIIATIMGTFNMETKAQKNTSGKKVLIAYFSRRIWVKPSAFASTPAVPSMSAVESVAF